MKNYSIIKKDYSKRNNIKEKYNIYKNGLNVGAGIRMWLKGGRGDQKCASWNLFDFRINFWTAIDIVVFVVWKSEFSGVIPNNKISNCFVLLNFKKLGM